MPDKTNAITECVNAYTRGLRLGELPRAYRAIISVLTSFKTAWEGAYPNDRVGALYQGYMDMSFVSFSPALLAEKRLKISLVYLHPEGVFSLWLAAGNRAIQAEVSAALKEKPLGGYTLSELKPGVDAIIAYDVAPPYDFDDPAALTELLVLEALSFQRDMTALLDF